ncbi:SDR family oxidoreductase [Thermocatellispora tengchongensis]|uniref:SDR family oxidoreductase n=1 Tax=Thermocatellispora tengchongensis TaxID=1073253 RepID=UPI0036270B3F
MRILVTGATGIVGSEVMRTLRAAPGVEVQGVSRSGDAARGVAKWHLGAEPPPAVLRGPWDAVVHSAADIRWNLPFDQARRANIASTEAVLGLVGPETTVVHVSSAFAAGLRGDVASDDPADYRNSYEWSKAAAERLVDAACPNWTVRPPMIIGRRADGHIARFHGVYQVLQGYLWGALPVMVANDACRVELVPVDEVAAVVAARALAGRPAAKEVATLGAGDGALSGAAVVKIVFDELNAWRAGRGVPPVGLPPLIAPRRWERFFRPFAEQHLSRGQLALIHAFDPYLPYWAMEDHLRPDTYVVDVEDALRASIRYWADRHPQGRAPRRGSGAP